MRDWRRKLRSLWSPEGDPLVFFIAAFLVGISINLAANRIEGSLKESHSTQWAFVIIFGVAGIIVMAMITARWRPRKPVGSHLEKVRKAKGLIALVSSGSVDTVRAAIVYHHSALLKVWLICSSGGVISSEADAEGLKFEYESQGILPPGTIQVVRLKNPDFEDPEAVKYEIERIFETLPHPLADQDVIIDITGGRKTTTAGAFLAGLPEGRRLEIINPLDTDESGHGTKAGDPVEIVIDYSMKRIQRR